MRVLFLSTNLEHFSFWEELSEPWSKMHIGLHVKCRVLLSDCNETWNRLAENTQIPNFTKIRSVWAKLLQADGRTDAQTYATNSRFSQFCERA